MVSDIYQGSRRMTLTYPMLNRARMILWLIIGEDKAPMLPRLIAGDTSVPAGRIERDRAILIADRSAAASLKEHRL
jgi:6-phosphogluconolactonase